MAATKSVTAQSVHENLNSSKVDDARIEHVLGNLLKLASGEFDVKELPLLEYDRLDAIDRGIVMLGEHLQDSKIEQENNIQEKENLLKEVHHRVKNNLQIISSLLNLQARYTKNDSAKQSLKQSQYRISSMAMIHEMLYKSDDITKIHFEDYLTTLTSSLVDSIRGNSTGLELNISAPSIDIDLDTAVNLGLLINEIFTNAIIHGIPEGKKGRIYVHVIKKDDDLTLLMGDNGIGFHEKDASESLGLQLIETFSDQLDGKLIRTIKDGTHYKLSFHHPAH